MQIVICDIDGTLSDCTHRLKYLNNGVRKDWDGFFAAADKDTINPWCYDLLWTLDKKYHVVMVTGRPERTREATTAWLLKHHVPYCALYMRPDFYNVKPDHRQDCDVKRELYEKYIKGLDVAFVIDDRTQVVNMWRSLGLTVLQCANGNY